MLMVDLIDAKASTRYTIEGLANTLWLNENSMDGMFREASLGQLGFEPDTNNDGVPDIFGPFSLNETAAGCGFSNWATKAEEQAVAQGIDLSQYQHRIFVLPYSNELPDCRWSGVANVGCSSGSCRSWIAEGESPMVFAHELGHNLGMAHAGADPENDGQINASYGDYSDVMGLSRRWHKFNAAHIDQMGWYDAFPGRLTNITESGTYQMAVLGSNSDSIPEILKIQKPDSNEYYYLSYRDRIGYDFGLTDGYLNGVNVHRYKGAGYGFTAHIMTLFDLGQFTDSINDLAVTQLSHDSQSVTLEINFDLSQAPCIGNSPTLSMNPLQGYANPTEGPQNYTLTITNNDPSSCGATEFSFQYTGEPLGSISPMSIGISPGATATVELSVIPLGMAEQSYQLPITVKDLDGVLPVHADVINRQAYLTIDGTPPSVPEGITGLVEDGFVHLTWLASTDALARVSDYLIYRDGVEIGATNFLSFDDYGVAAGNIYEYQIASRDYSGNLSDRSVIAVVELENPPAAIFVTDLDDQSVRGSKGKWNPIVLARVENSLGSAVTGAQVVGRWSSTPTVTVVCTVDGSGACNLQGPPEAKKTKWVTFHVDEVIFSGFPYDASLNRDGDGDSNGVNIRLNRP